MITTPRFLQLRSPLSGDDAHTAVPAGLYHRQLTGMLSPCYVAGQLTSGAFRVVPTPSVGLKRRLAVAAAGQLHRCDSHLELNRTSTDKAILSSVSGIAEKRLYVRFSLAA